MRFGTDGWEILLWTRAFAFHRPIVKDVIDKVQDSLLYSFRQLAARRLSCEVLHTILGYGVEGRTLVVTHQAMARGMGFL